MTTLIDELRTAGVLSDLDVQFVRTLADVASEQRDEVLLACALAMRASTSGDVCVDLGAIAGTEIWREDGTVSEHRWPALKTLVTALRSTPVCSNGSAQTPLVLDGENRLYLERYYRYEARLAADIQRRTKGSAVVDSTLPDAERAVALARSSRFSVITGGPGTGKSTLVAVILLALREDGPLRVLLLAPTGKAAMRLQEAVRQGCERLSGSDGATNMTVAVQTIHRALGVIGGPLARFRHTAANPLAADVVVVDEASMVDLSLMVHLLDAILPTSRVLLVGDRDQLSSVEAGSVLRDICYGADEQVPASDGLASRILTLRHTYRFGPDSGIGQLAAAVNRGDAKTGVQLLKDAAFGDLCWIRPGRWSEVREQLVQMAQAGFHSMRSAGSPQQQLEALSQFRILCAVRQGEKGADDLRRCIDQALFPAGAVSEGRPVLVLRNDYTLHLFNGDTGVVIDTPEGPRVAFMDAADGIRWIHPDALPANESAVVTTVHKSQGSEFEHTVLVLPSRLSPVLSRELLYTAITRARRRLTIVASEEILEHCIRTSVDRRSGLRDRLWRGMPGC